MYNMYHYARVPLILDTYLSSMRMDVHHIAVTWLVGGLIEIDNNAFSVVCIKTYTYELQDTTNLMSYVNVK